MKRLALLALLPFALPGSVLATVSLPELASQTVLVAPVPTGFSAEARVEAVRSATLAAQIAGRVTEIRVEPGQAVKKGEVLLSIDARELAGMDAAGQASLAQAAAQWQRSQQLYQQKFISRSALDQAELTYKAAQGNAGASGASLSYARVSAPFGGVIGERLIEPGEMAAPGRALLSVHDPASLRVIASVPQSRLPALKAQAGTKAVVEVVESGRRMAVKRVEVLPTVDPVSHTVTLRLYLADGETGLAPGMAVRAHVLTGSAEKLVVPAQAVVRRGEVSGVYVLDNAATSSTSATNATPPRLRQVRLGEVLPDGRIEVLAGLNSGERVALDPVKAGLHLKQK